MLRNYKEVRKKPSQRRIVYLYISSKRTRVMGFHTNKSRSSTSSKKSCPSNIKECLIKNSKGADTINAYLTRKLNVYRPLTYKYAKKALQRMQVIVTIIAHPFKMAHIIHNKKMWIKISPHHLKSLTSQRFHINYKIGLQKLFYDPLNVICELIPLQ